MISLFAFMKLKITFTSYFFTETERNDSSFEGSASGDKSKDEYGDEIH